MDTYIYYAHRIITKANHLLFRKRRYFRKCIILLSAIFQQIAFTTERILRSSQHLGMGVRNITLKHENTNNSELESKSIDAKFHVTTQAHAKLFSSVLELFEVDYSGVFRRREMSKMPSSFLSAKYDKMNS